MQSHDIIVIGASAGGVEATTRIARELTPDLPASIFVVVHIPQDASSFLSRILDSAGPLPAMQAKDGAPIVPGHIYVAVPDHHLLVERGHIRVVRGPRENRTRPAVDPLFRTAARAYGPRVIGVVLTGALDDGTAGLMAIKRRGGLAVVQDPYDALMPSMPSSALQYVKSVDAVLPLDQIAPRLVELARRPVPEEVGGQIPRELDLEARLAEADGAAMDSDERSGTLTGFTCPECRGPLWEVRDGNLLRFRCRTGHAFSAESLMAGQSEEVEQALWMAVNVMEENWKIAERLARDAHLRNSPRLARRLEERAREKRRHIDVLRRILLESGENGDDTEDEQANRAANNGNNRTGNRRSTKRASAKGAEDDSA